MSWLSLMLDNEPPPEGLLGLSSLLSLLQEGEHCGCHEEQRGQFFDLFEHCC